MSNILENLVRYNSYRLKAVLLIGFAIIIAFALMLRFKKSLLKYLLLILGASIIFTIPLMKISKKEVETRDKYERLIQSQIEEYIPGIVCWGDSLTGGADSDYSPYPTDLQAYLEEKYSEMAAFDVSIPVVNMGNGGENSINIVGRSGRIPFTVNAFTIPQTTTPVEISFEKIQGKKVVLGINGNFNGVNHCIIDGVAGDLSGSEEQYYFTRLEAGDEVSVSQGTKLVTFGEQNWDYYSTCINIIFMGANGGYDDIDDLIAQQHALIDDMAEGNDKYLIITTTGKDRAEYAELEAAMLNEYGDKYLNLRDYLCSDAIYDAGLTPSNEELEEMEQGIVPESLRKDAIHYNEYSTPLVAKHIMNKLYELGYFDELDNYMELVADN